jgi:hypothetical protein
MSAIEDRGAGKTGIVECAQDAAKRNGIKASSHGHRGAAPALPESREGTPLL